MALMRLVDDGVEVDFNGSAIVLQLYLVRWVQEHEEMGIGPVIEMSSSSSVMEENQEL